MDFGYDETTRDLRERAWAFIEDFVFPAEQYFHDIRGAYPLRGPPTAPGAITGGYLGTSTPVRSAWWIGVSGSAWALHIRSMAAMARSRVF